MPRFLLGWLLGLGGNAIGLLLAWLLLGSDFSINGPIGFIVSLVVFAILSAFFTWLVFKGLDKKAATILPLTGLISTFLALLVTALLTDGLSISGWGWLWGTIIVWILSMVIWVLPGPWRSYRAERITKTK
jgi:hypothetical protein